MRKNKDLPIYDGTLNFITKAHTERQLRDSSIKMVYRRRILRYHSNHSRSNFKSVQPPFMMNKKQYARLVSCPAINTLFYTPHRSTTDRKTHKQTGKRQSACTYSTILYNTHGGEECREREQLYTLYCTVSQHVSPHVLPWK